MTAVTQAPAPATASPLTRHPVWRIVRLHLVNPATFIGIPWLIVGVAFGFSLGITLIVRIAGNTEPAEGMRYSWAALAPQWYLVVVGILSVAYTFSYALGLGSTRRDFWLGTSLLFGMLAVVNAAAYTALVQIEKATDGWWLGMHMFDALWLGTGQWWIDFFSIFSLQLFVFFIGSSATTVYMRWRIPGMVWIGAIFALLILVLIAVMTWTGSWPGVIAWFGSIGIAGIFGLLLAFTAVVSIAGYLVIRRATPR